MNDTTNNAPATKRIKVTELEVGMIIVSTWNNAPSYDEIVSVETTGKNITVRFASNLMTTWYYKRTAAIVDAS